VVNSPTIESKVVHATTDDGLRLPVIDVTQSAFALLDDPQSVAALAEAFAETERRNAWVPPLFMRFMLRRAAERSQLLRAVVEPQSDFLPGLTTYIMKLGAENLPAGFDSDVDRRMAASPHLLAVRLRLQQTAKLLAEGLEPLLAGRPAAPLVLVNIGGGPAIDSLNALILLRRSQSTLSQRPIAIQVLDIDPAGPRFGAAALAALSAQGQPLAGLDITFTHEVYDWNKRSLLGDVVYRASAQGAILAASSEGALFEYGSDDAIVANLATLHHGGRGAKLVVGSVTGNDPVRRRVIANSHFKLVPRGLDGFRPLAERGGFAIVRSLPTPLSDQVSLAPV
jgi:hypothetical protein